MISLLTNQYKQIHNPIHIHYTGMVVTFLVAWLTSSPLEKKHYDRPETRPQTSASCSVGIAYRNFWHCIKVFWHIETYRPAVWGAVRRTKTKQQLTLDKTQKLTFTCIFCSPLVSVNCQFTTQSMFLFFCHTFSNSFYLLTALRDLEQQCFGLKCSWNI